jgi:FSR family fosmidomycin resistance protein-like MFS transporter
MDRKRVFFISALHFWSDIYSVFFPVYMVIVGLDPVKSSLIAAVSSLLANGLQPLMGFLSDRMLRAGPRIGKLPVFLGLTIGAASTSLIGATRSYPLLFLLVVVGRLGISLFHPGAASAAAAATATAAVRGGGSAVGLSTFLAVGIVGMALSQPYFSLFTARFGNASSGLLAIPAVALALVYLFSQSAGADTTTTEIGLAQAGRIFLRHLGVMVLLLLIMILRYGYITAVGFFAAKLFADWGFSRLSYSSANTFYNLASAAGIFASGYLARRLRPRALLALSQTLFLPFLAALLFAGARGSLWPAFAALGAVGFVLSLSNVANISLGYRLLPELTSTVSGLLMGFAWSIGEFALPLGAAFADRLPWAPGLASGLVLLSLFPLLASGLAILLPSALDADA